MGTLAAVTKGSFAAVKNYGHIGMMKHLHAINPTLVATQHQSKAWLRQANRDL